MEKEFAVLRIEADGIAGQQINGEIRREERNIVAGVLRDAVAAIAGHELSKRATKRCEALQRRAEGTLASRGRAILSLVAPSSSRRSTRLPATRIEQSELAARPASPPTQTAMAGSNANP